MISFDAERQLAAQEPWLDESRDNIFALSAELEPQPEFLAATSEGGRVKDIKVALLKLGEANDRIDRTEGGPNRQ